MGKIFKSKKPKGPSSADRQRQKDMEEQTIKLQREQREEGLAKDSEIAEARYKLKKKAKGRASLLSGGAAGVDNDTLG